jgi:hypothetical protein
MSPIAEPPPTTCSLPPLTIAAAVDTTEEMKAWPLGRSAKRSPRHRR